MKTRLVYPWYFLFILVFSTYGNIQAQPITKVDKMKLVTYTASPGPDNVYLKWSVVSENRNNYFWIERSTNGIDYNVIGYTEFPESVNDMEYLFRFTDENPEKGKMWYRILCLEQDEIRLLSSSEHVQYAEAGNTKAAELITSKTDVDCPDEKE